jgi:hypothetical protein
MTSEAEPEQACVANTDDNNDDDLPLTLSSETFAALAEFYKEQEEREQVPVPIRPGPRKIIQYLVPVSRIKCWRIGPISTGFESDP